MLAPPALYAKKHEKYLYLVYSGDGAKNLYIIKKSKIIIQICAGGYCENLEMYNIEIWADLLWIGGSGKNLYINKNNKYIY